jgi:hypothetical protein
MEESTVTYSDLGGLSRRTSLDLDALRSRLRGITESELLAFGKQMHSLSFPLTYDFRSKPTFSAFSVQLEATR